MASYREFVRVPKTELHQDTLRARDVTLRAMVARRSGTILDRFNSVRRHAYPLMSLISAMMSCLLWPPRGDGLRTGVTATCSSTMSDARLLAFKLYRTDLVESTMSVKCENHPGKTGNPSSMSSRQKDEASEEDRSARCSVSSAGTSNKAVMWKPKCVQ